MTKKTSELFGKVNVYDPAEGKKRVEIYIRLNQRLEGMKMGIAVDGSASMMQNFSAQVPPAFRQPGDNQVETVTRTLTQYLSSLSGDGSSKLIYWAVGPGGKEIEEIGNVSVENAMEAKFDGPAAKQWGTKTFLLPVLKYYMEEYQDQGTNWVFLLIITDGIFEDMAETKNYCMEIAKEMVETGRKLKFVIVGVGSEVDKEQIDELDDMFDGTEFEDDVDLWDGKLANRMIDIPEVTDEVDWGVTLPGTVRITDDQGNEVYSKTDGFPNRMEFKVDEGATSVTVEIAGQVIEQPLE
jgi:hypothetical protein